MTHRRVDRLCEVSKTRRLVLVAFAVLTTACGSGDSPAGPPPPSSGPDTAVARIEVSPTSAMIAIDGSIALSVTARNAAGDMLGTSGYAWSSADTLVASVSSSGIADGRSDGVTRVVARRGTVADTADVTVLPVIQIGAREGVVLRPVGVSHSGRVAGWIVGTPFARPFVLGSDLRVTILPIPTGRNSAAANAVSDAGVVVGTASEAGPNVQSGRAVVWSVSPAGESAVAELPLIEGFSASSALGLSGDAVYAVGIIRREVSPGRIDDYPVRWTRTPAGAWSVERLPIPDGATGIARAVNSRGEVVGNYSSVPLGSQSVSWRRSADGTWSSEKLGVAGAEGTAAYAINDAGNIVGRAGGLPVSWSIAEPRMQQALTNDLGYASAINAAGAVTGVLTPTGAGTQAFRWEAGRGISALQSPLGAGIAVGITATGQVAGVSSHPTNVSITPVGTLWLKR